MSRGTGNIPSEVRVDWLSFTRKIAPSLTPRESINKVKEDLVTIPNVAVLLKGDIAEWKMEAPRYPYKMRVVDETGGISVYVGDSADHYLIEISGRGCEGWGKDSKCVRGVLEEIEDRITRIDIAVDLLCDVDPVAFANRRDNKRHTGKSIARSATGDTIYIGSRKSDRYCRVYRYKPPHPRADYLRVEHVFRQEQARVAAAEVIECGLRVSAAKAGEIYQWRHAVWNGVRNGEVAKIEAWRPERKKANTVRWFLLQVVPALKELIEGDILSKEFIIRAVCGDMTEEEVNRTIDRYKAGSENGQEGLHYACGPEDVESDNRSIRTDTIDADELRRVLSI